MKIIVSILSLCAIIGIIILLNKKGLMQHSGCTCRKADHDHNNG